MTKADRIRATAKKHPNWTTVQIGDACDCSDSYVRVVLRQRGPDGISDCDRRYRARPEYRAKANGYSRAWYRRQKAKREATCPPG
jgi:hypothetical protein